MQEPFRNKKSRGYRLRPASGRDRLDSRVRRLCSRLGILAVVVAAAIVIRIAESGGRNHMGHTP